MESPSAVTWVWTRIFGDLYLMVNCFLLRPMLKASPDLQIQLTTAI